MTCEMFADHAAFLLALTVELRIILQGADAADEFFVVSAVENIVVVDLLECVKIPQDDRFVGHGRLEGDQGEGFIIGRQEEDIRDVAEDVDFVAFDDTGKAQVGGRIVIDLADLLVSFNVFAEIE